MLAKPGSLSSARDQKRKRAECAEVAKRGFLEEETVRTDLGGCKDGSIRQGEGERKAWTKRNGVNAMALQELVDKRKGCEHRS